LVLFQPAILEYHRHVACGFQSHFGLISTLLPWVQKLGVATFQSHFGLISTLDSGCGHVDRSNFQSHFGLISTSVTGSRERNEGGTFNPTLVLFQQEEIEPPSGWGCTFNPTLVLFQRRTSACSRQAGSTFNPTLVLFQRSYDLRPVAHTIAVFQSHFGLISTHTGLHPHHHAHNFQSHFGLISTVESKAPIPEL